MKCAWCSNPIVERRGRKSIRISRGDNSHKGWAHEECYREWYSTVCFEMPSTIVDKNGHWTGWAKSGNAMCIWNSFNLACGPVGNSEADFHLKYGMWKLLPMVSI